jgi:alpha-L-rhamnosidase
MKILKLTCEFLENPIGIDSKNPRLGWIYENERNERNKSQSAYQILVASSNENIEKDIGDLWDTGIIKNNNSAHIEYSGKDLKSKAVYYWKVKGWDENNTDLGWSLVATWTMGIYPEDWKGKWIAARLDVSYEERFPVSTDLLDCPDWIKAAARREHPKGPGPENDFASAVYFRKDFSISKQIKKATIHVSGLGYYELSLNGIKIGDHVLDPGATDYTKSVLYVAYDITESLSEQNNCLGITLGNGWYWVGTPDLFGFEKADWATPPKCLINMDIYYTDGSTETIMSDKSWSCTEKGPIRFNCIRSGEVYDARMELGSWDQYKSVNATDERWQDVLIAPSPKGILRSQISPPMKEMDIFGPCDLKILEDGNLVYYFPKNNAGWIQLKVKGQKGQVIKIELNETLNKDGSIDMNKHSGHTYGRYQTCEYICKGNDIEIWHPRFCYAGFQYVQISGATEDNIIEILAKQICTSFKTSGEFNCSNILINNINDASKLTFLNGFHSYPEDCPQREKAGWTEDALISAHGSIYNFDGLLAYEKWIRDLMDAQHEATGQVPDIVPTPLWGKPTTVRDKDQSGSWTSEELGNMADPWWGGTLVMLPWRIYCHYGDTQILQIAYESMKKYVDFLVKTTEYEKDQFSYLIHWSGFLGDWLEVGAGGSATRTPRILTTTQAFYQCAKVVSKVAGLLNIKEDESKYSSIAEKIFEAFNEEFLDESTGLYWKDSQSAQAMSLVLGLSPINHEKQIFDQLVQNVEVERKGHLSTGIVGTYFLYEALAQHGRSDLVFNVLTANDYPGFEYMLTRVNENTPLPSKTLWEDWKGVSSLAHPVQGCVVAYLYEYLAGIQTDLDKPGFLKFYIKPTIVGDLQWVKASMDTLYGKIISNWQLDENIIKFHIEVPVNTECLFEIPTTKVDEILESKNVIKTGNGIRKIEKMGKNTFISLGSGIYDFKIPKIS